MSDAGRRWKLGASIAVVLIAIAVLHVPIARMLGGGCPFGRDRALTAEQQDRIRTRATARLGTGERAAARPAGAFVLGTTHRPDVVAWAAAQGMTCRAGRDRAGLVCEADSSREIVYADFDRTDRLVALSALSRMSRAARAADELATAEAELTRTVGPATSTSGRRSERYLAARPLRQARTQYRRADYFAQLSATNLGSDSYLVSRTYRAIER